MWDAGNFAAVAEKILDAGETVVSGRRRRARHGRARRGVRHRQRDAAGGEGRRRGSPGSTSRPACSRSPASALPTRWSRSTSSRATRRRCRSTTAASTASCRRFGHMFAPDHRRTADEMKRVLPAGRRDRGRVLDARGRDRADVPRDRPSSCPPPPGGQPPVLWGTEDHVREMWGDDASSSAHEIVWTDESVESYARFMLDSFGPLLNARELLGEREDELDRGLPGLPRARERGRRRHAPLPRRVPVCRSSAASRG